ncbi:putative transcriptional regulator [Lachnospiraceae bacterium PM6-15]|uniref:hypothetical protein n=1 Tax=Ohessyouella blattaphilus TaxID=2949333 RepID=UPI003E29A1DF
MRAKRVNTGLRISLELNEKIEKIAEQTDQSKNALIVQVLWEYVKNKEKETM